MSDIKPPRSKAGRTLAVLAGFVAVFAISLLTYNVTKEIKELGGAKSDNVQWSLTQTEVEFLNFTIQLNEPEPNLIDIRRTFDVFYSRIQTVKTARVFANLRSNSGIQVQIQDIQSFLDRGTDIVDAKDADFLTQLPELKAAASSIQPVVRRLANSGLEQYAKSADQQRKEVANTLIQLAVAVAALFAALAFLVYYLKRLNDETTKREQEQKHTVDRMNTVLGTSLDGVIVSNSEGKIIEFNPAAEAIFGQNVQDVIGKEIGDVIVPDHLRDAHDAGMMRMRARGEKRVVGKGRVTLEAKRANGDLFPIELAIQSAITDEGEVFIAFMRDISERVADQQELEEARDRALAGEKMKTDFLATMSHEIRTPLNGLLGNMDLLRDTKLNMTQDRYMRNMETSGRLLMSHISDVLDITRYDAGKLSTKSEPVDVSSLLQDILDSQSSMAAANETTLDWGWDGAPQNWINSDKDRLQHVLMNLIGNAVKFTKRGKVSLTAMAEQSSDGHTITFEIADTGPGISHELCERIFDDFVTGNTAYDRDVGGTGLGLSIAKRFVDALNGDIWVESIEGEGSRFFVKLPVTIADPKVIDDSHSEAAVTLQKLNILLVEDNEINRIVACEMLEADGHSVTQAHDGQQGVQVAQTQAFDLILMDISMPIMDGRTATRAIRAGDGKSANCCIVALTANAMIEEQESFKLDGMNATLTKPLTKNALRQVLQGIVSGGHDDQTSYVDEKHILETKEVLGKEAFGKLQVRFTREVGDLIDWLQSDQALDRTDILSRCHKVAGSASVFGAIELHKHLKSMEAAAKSGQDDRMNGLIQALPTLWAQSKKHIT